jgi:hypothetical protein
VGFGAVCPSAPVAEAAFPGANGRIVVSTFPGMTTAKYDGSDIQQLSAEWCLSPRWSPDGTKLVFYRDLNGVPGIWVINADGSGEHRIRPTGYKPSWSADGTKIVFEDGAPRRLYVMNADGTNAHQVPVESEFGTAGALRDPAWSPDGQTIAYVDDLNGDGRALYLVDPDGSNRRLVYRYPDDVTNFAGGVATLEWLPDSSRIAYVREERNPYRFALITVRPDGTGEAELGEVGVSDSNNPIVWSPDGTYFANRTEIYWADDFATDRHVWNLGGWIMSWQPIATSAANLSVRMRTSPNPVVRGDSFTYKIVVKHVTGSATSAQVTDTVPNNMPVESATSTQGSCTIAGQDVTCALGTLQPGTQATVAITVTMTVAANNVVRNTATAQPAGSDPDPLNNSATVETSVSPPPGYPRPVSAATLDIPLVPAYARCVSANRTHGPPLGADSCSPPTQASGYLTVGTPDANGQPASSSASEHVRVVPGTPPPGVDDADVRFTVSATDVRKRSDLADYTGELRVTHTLRITDRFNNLNEYPNGIRGTLTDYVFAFTMPCTATASTQEGSSCTVATTAEALVPGSVPESKRSVWEVGQLTVLDGGPDGVASTDDNTVFLKQGLFVP